MKTRHIFLSLEDHQCTQSRCVCLFELRRAWNAPALAASADREAIVAAARLLGIEVAS